nr:hypothetical protein CFP56_70616 [Quercus suber]
MHKYSHSPSIKDLSQSEVKHKRNTSIHARDAKKLRKIIDEHLEKEARWNTSINVPEFKDHRSILDWSFGYYKGDEYNSEGKATSTASSAREQDMLLNLSLLSSGSVDDTKSFIMA